MVKPENEVIRINFKQKAINLKNAVDLSKTSKSDETVDNCSAMPGLKKKMIETPQITKKNEKVFDELKQEKDKKSEKPVEKRKLSVLEEILVVSFTMC